MITKEEIEHYANRIADPNFDPVFIPSLIGHLDQAKVIGVNPSTIDKDVAAGNPASTSKKPNKIKAAKAPSAGNPARSLSGAAAAEAVAEKEAKVIRGTQGTGENEWYTPVSTRGQLASVP